MGVPSLLSVIVPSARSTTVLKTIEAIREQTDPSWELIVSDQSGNDSLAPQLAALDDERIRRVACPGKGASLARNYGILHARGDVLCFTDDDCRPRRDWLAVIRGLFDAEPDLWMATGSIVPPPDLPTSGIFECPSYVAEERRGYPASGEARIYSVTANAAYRRVAFDQAGPFDICLSPGTEFCGGEEDDHDQRMALFNPLFLSTPRMEVEHTYGVRYGLQAAWKIKRNYAISVGANAGKSSLLGRDGEAVCRHERQRAVASLNLLRTRDLHRTAPRAFFVQKGYRRLLTGYSVDLEHRLLVPRGRCLEEMYQPIAKMLEYRLPQPSSTDT